MRAMVLKKASPIETNPLVLEDVPVTQPAGREILLEISACGVCRTELDEIEGRLPTKLPVIPGHQIVGRIKDLGPDASRYRIGQRLGVAWIYRACGLCCFCNRGLENLCDRFMGTGCDADGGYAEYILVHEDFAYPIPDTFEDHEAAPLLCAGAIGYRALKLTGMRDGETIGLFGFGSSAHIQFQLIKYLFPTSRIFVFTRRKGDAPSELAMKMGADWVGETGETPPEKLDCAIDTTPIGSPVKEALRNLEKGGRLVMNLIRKETPITDLDYASHLWGEREVKSVANITRTDVQEFLEVAAKIPIRPEVKKFRLEEANEALLMLKRGQYRGSGVLIIKC
ncbi:MAG: zinc-dependent alcohol dehydrogenase family protein [Candidatus Methanomethyliaceae archaeon]|nr:zinc-dependent alcohol dehydrogenase family protein [Candidatus Methanomethyliaceae archaeon]